MAYVGKGELILDEPTQALRALQRNRKDDRLLPDFIAQVYGYEDRDHAKREGVYIRCFRTTQLDSF